MLNMVNKGKHVLCAPAETEPGWTSLGWDRLWIQAPAHVLSLSSVQLLAAILYCLIAIFLQTTTTKNPQKQKTKKE